MQYNNTLKSIAKFVRNICKRAIFVTSFLIILCESNMEAPIHHHAVGFLITAIPRAKMIIIYVLCFHFLESWEGWNQK